MAGLRVALVNMPFATVERPALGLSLLKAGVRQAGHECDVLYPNLDFAVAVGRDVYDRLALALPEWIMGGDLVFRHALAGRDLSDNDLRRVLAVEWGLRTPDVEDVLHAARQASGFIGRCLEAVDWPAYNVVGFTSFCSQNVAALAMARALKTRHPALLVVFGGPNWDGDMGRALFSRYEFVDVVCLGEADRSFPCLLTCLDPGDPERMSDVGGILFRSGSERVDTGPPDLVDDLDLLPLPDHSDYFSGLEACGMADQPTTIGIEGSRGCWWAEKGPCRFCGQNGSSRRYRKKSFATIVSELRDAPLRWGCSGVDLVDNVVSDDFLDSVVPELAARPLGVPIFFEARPELTRSQVAEIAKLDGAIQIGIESLDDHVLQLMHKGSSALRNVRLLKWCAMEGVVASWNLLFGFPGETQEDYKSLVDLVPSLTHLQAPKGCGRVCLDRFSPYFEEPERFGFTQIRPRKRYALAYGLDESATGGLAYTFSYELDDDFVLAACVRRLTGLVHAWQDAAPAELRLDTKAGRHVVRDTRPVAKEPEIEVDELDRALLSLCEDGMDEAAMMRRAAVDAGVQDAPHDAVARRIVRLQERRWVVPLSGKLLSLVLPGRSGAGVVCARRSCRRGGLPRRRVTGRHRGV